ncbi:MAG: NifB/NifX family molybdenum-iron cluster-binding protein [Candidatus Kryptoniota bacterium]
MKIAVVTMDGSTVSQHFGRSPYYAVITVDNGKISSRELRPRGTGHFAPGGPQHGGDLDEGGRHGYGSAARISHAAMAQEISDCQVLIAGGMGSGAYENFKEAGLEVILTDYNLIDDAVKAYTDGTLKNLAAERTD